MVDGALLIVDAAEGPLSQTKFVLKKALDYGLKIILVINKIDRKDERVKEVVRDTENLFLSLAADEELLDFPVIYAIGKEGKTFFEMPAEANEKGDTTPLFETILKYIPQASKNEDSPFQMLISSFEKNEYLGKLAVGRVNAGTIKRNVGIFSRSEQKFWVILK